VPETATFVQKVGHLEKHESAKSTNNGTKQEKTRFDTNV